MAEFRAALAPPRIARAPPVKKPAITIHAMLALILRPFSPQSQPRCHPLSLRNHPIRDWEPVLLEAHTSIIWILLLPHSLNRTIKRRKQTTPNPEISS